MAALCGDYSPFEEFVKYLNLHLNYSNSSIIYFICDCTGSSFKNKHFEQTFILEKWCIKNLPKGVIRLSIYPGYLFNKAPYKFNVKTIQSNDSTTVLIHPLSNHD